jgi:hypothetical protein
MTSPPSTCCLAKLTERPRASTVRSRPRIACSRNWGRPDAAADGCGHRMGMRALHVVGVVGLGLAGLLAWRVWTPRPVRMEPNPMEPTSRLDRATPPSPAPAAMELPAPRRATPPSPAPARPALPFPPLPRPRALRTDTAPEPPRSAPITQAPPPAPRSDPGSFAATAANTWPEAMNLADLWDQTLWWALMAAAFPPDPEVPPLPATDPGSPALSPDLLADQELAAEAAALAAKSAKRRVGGDGVTATHRAAEIAAREAAEHRKPMQRFHGATQP